MKNSYDVIISVAMGLSILAAPAGAKDPNGAEMSFLSFSAVPVQGMALAARVEQRAGDRMVVRVSEPAHCDTRISAPEFALGGGELRLQYLVPAPPVGAGACLATALFSFRNLPEAPVTVVASAQPVPAPEALAVADSDNGLAPGFLALEAGPVHGVAQRFLEEVRSQDRIIAVVGEPAACGSRLSDPSVELAGSRLAFHYKVAAPEGGNAPCAARAVFSLRGLPDRSFEVVALASPQESSAVVAMAAPDVAVPRMSMVAAPAVPGNSQRMVVQALHGDTLNVVARDPAPCGERTRSARFSVSGNELAVRYDIASANGRATCVGTTMLSFSGLPAGVVRAVALAQDPAQAGDITVANSGN
jgi:hypothetical protein